MKNTVLVFGGLITALLILFRVGRYSLFSGDTRTEILLAITALAFLGIGLLVRKQKPSPLPGAEEEVVSVSEQLKVLAITSREMEVLQLLAAGLSNREGVWQQSHPRQCDSGKRGWDRQNFSSSDCLAENPVT